MGDVVSKVCGVAVSRPYGKSVDQTTTITRRRRMVRTTSLLVFVLSFLQLLCDFSDSFQFSSIPSISRFTSSHAVLPSSSMVESNFQRHTPVVRNSFVLWGKKKKKNKQDKEDKEKVQESTSTDPENDTVDPEYLTEFNADFWNLPANLSELTSEDVEGLFGVNERRAKRLLRKYSEEELVQKKKTGAVRKYFKNELGMDNEETKLIERLYPWMYANESVNGTFKPMVAKLREHYNLRNRCIRGIFKDYPFIVQQPFNVTQEKLDYVMKTIRLNNKEIRFILEHQPLILSLAIEEIKDHLHFFEKTVEFNKRQLKLFFMHQFRVWKTPLQYLKDYYGKYRALNFSPEQIQKKLLSNLSSQKKFSFDRPLLDSYDERYLTEFLD